MKTTVIKKLHTPNDVSETKMLLAYYKYIKQPLSYRPTSHNQVKTTKIPGQFSSYYPRSIKKHLTYKRSYHFISTEHSQLHLQITNKYLLIHVFCAYTNKYKRLVEQTPGVFPWLTDRLGKVRLQKCHQCTS